MQIFKGIFLRNSKASKRLVEEIELLRQSPLLDPVWYLEVAVTSGYFESGRAHFDLHGFKEIRSVGGRWVLPPRRVICNESMGSFRSRRHRDFAVDKNLYRRVDADCAPQPRHVRGSGVRRRAAWREGPNRPAETSAVLIRFLRLRVRHRLPNLKRKLFPKPRLPPTVLVQLTRPFARATREALRIKRFLSSNAGSVSNNQVCSIHRGILSKIATSARAELIRSITT
jgi:hypothetical protein